MIARNRYRIEITNSLDAEFYPKLNFSVIKSAINKFNPDVVVTYGGPETNVASLLKGMNQFKLLRFRGGDFTAPYFSDLLRQKLSLCRVDSLILPSKAVKEKADQFVPTKTIVLPLGCDEKKFTIVNNPSRNGEILNLMILGRLDPVKGHTRAFAILKDALAIWPSDLPTPMLNVVGQPANLTVDELKKSVEDFEIADHVRFVATKVDDLGQEFSKMHLGWIPSVGSELICRVAHEFNLCGIPTLVSGVGSLIEASDGILGSSYDSLPESEIAAELIGSCRRSLNMSPEQRAEIRSEALSVHSYSSMGRSLDKMIQSLFV